MNKTFTVIEPSGFHARPSTILASTAKKFEGDILVTYKDTTVNAKSMMRIMTLGITTEAQFTLEGNEDAISAIESALQAAKVIS